MFECYIKKRDLVFPFLGAILFVTLGILLVTGIIGVEEGAAEIDRIGGVVIGWAVIIFFGGLLGLAIISNLKSSSKVPVIRIDEQGFFDRRFLHQPIPWSAIRSVHIFRGKTVYTTPIRFISLDVIEPDTYQIKGIGRYFPRFFKILKKIYDEPGITITTSLLDHSPDEILLAIKNESKGKVSIQ